MNKIKNLILATLAALAVTVVCPISSALADESPGNSQVVVTFTKWVLNTGVMPGVVGGDLGSGDFAGQLLGGIPKADGKILKLDARYGVVVGGGRSFNAVIHGTMNSQTGIGVLNGVIVNGWLTGAQVKVRFQALPSVEHGTIFVGTITINPNSAD